MSTVGKKKQKLYQVETTELPHLFSGASNEDERSDEDEEGEEGEEGDEDERSDEDYCNDEDYWSGKDLDTNIKGILTNYIPDGIQNTRKVIKTPFHISDVESDEDEKSDEDYCDEEEYGSGKDLDINVKGISTKYIPDGIQNTRGVISTPFHPPDVESGEEYIHDRSGAESNINSN